MLTKGLVSLPKQWTGLVFRFSITAPLHCFSHKPLSHRSAQTWFERRWGFAQSLCFAGHSCHLQQISSHLLEVSSSGEAKPIFDHPYNWHCMPLINKKPFLICFIFHPKSSAEQHNLMEYKIIPSSGRVISSAALQYFPLHLLPIWKWKNTLEVVEMSHERNHCV